MVTTNDIRKQFPAAIAAYDLGEYYGIANSDERFCIVDKQNLSIVSVAMRYDREVIDAINRAIPVWYAQDDEE